MWGGIIVSVLKGEYLKKYTFLSIVVAVVATLGIVIVQLAKLYKDNFVLADELILIFFNTCFICNTDGNAYFLRPRGPLPREQHQSRRIRRYLHSHKLCLVLHKIFQTSQRRFHHFRKLAPVNVLFIYFWHKKRRARGFYIRALAGHTRPPGCFIPYNFYWIIPLLFAMVGLAGMFRYTPIFKK